MLIAVYVAVYALVVVFHVVCHSSVTSFLKTTPSIADEQSLDRFKAVARLNMRLALVAMLLFLIGIIAGVVIIFRYGGAGLVGVLLTNCVIIALALYLRGFEKRARSLPAASDDLAERYRRVSETWVKKALPDF